MAMAVWHQHQGKSLTPEAIIIPSAKRRIASGSTEIIGDRIWLLNGVRCAMVNRREGQPVQPVENGK